MCDILDMWYFYMQLQWMGPSKIKSFKNYAKFTTKIYTAYTVFQIFFLALLLVFVREGMFGERIVWVRSIQLIGWLNSQKICDLALDESVSSRVDSSQNIIMEWF